jgi:methylmalonyl-CoA mutase cobalamin-binding subunit
MHISNTKGTIILGGTESDAHVVSLYLATFMLEELGYSVVNRGCLNSTSDLMAPPHPDDAVLAYVICNQNGHALEDLRGISTHKRNTAPVILGGHYTLGCHDKKEQQRELSKCGVDYFVETLGELPVLLESLRSAEWRAMESRSNVG